MSTTTRCAPRLVLTLAVLTLLAAPGAWAFYPYGFFDDLNGGQLTLIRWPLSAFDTNDDGDVSGPNEGVVLNFELGNGDDGFDATEVAKVLSGFTEWELVSTAYVAFQQGPNITDPVELTGDLESIDAFNVVAFESDDDAAQESVTGGSIGIALVANTFEDTFVTIGDATVPLTGGQIIDVDTVLSQRARDLEVQPGGLMKASGVVLGGIGIGIDFSPLENTDAEASELAGQLVEDRVVAIRNFDGSIGVRGVTSSMINELIGYNDGGNNIVESHQDLAPDDIVAISYMYPRGELDSFFDLNQRARTRTGNNLPSQPIGGAWIRAWCDADNNAATARVPMFDTLTGLYYNGIDTSFRGHFKLPSMLKELETINEQTFTASYVMSCSEFLPIVFPGDERFIYDSTHGGFNQGSTGDGAIIFDSLFPAEVFNENGNLFGLTGVSQGTPLIFNLITRKIESQTSGKTLDVLLATGRPMFGDANQVCPLNVVIGPIDTGTQALAGLRSFRDDVLLTSALGAAVTEAYYRVAPPMAQFFAQHTTLAAIAQWFVAPARWIVVHAEWLLAAVAIALAGLVLRRRAGRVSAVAAGMVLFTLLAWLAPSAGAQMLPYELSDFLAQSDDVIVGKVGEVESRWINNNTKIITDVAIHVEDTIKGTQNAGGVVHLQLPTGRVGAIGRTSPQLPTFNTGEEVLVFLDAQKKGYAVAGGTAGKYLIAPHPKTGEKHVFSTSLAGHVRLEREIAKMHQEKAPDGIELANTKGPMKIDYDHRTLVKLDDFADYLRDLSKRQERQIVASEDPSK